MNVLGGVKVVDTSAYIFGPACGAVLAHWGADVVKVETTHGGDPIRGGTEPTEQLAIFHHYNRGKRGIALDLSATEGRWILRRLVEQADVFITSYLAPTRTKLMMDVEDIRAMNPNIIYVRASGQGPVGPDAERGGYDLTSWWARGSLAADAMRVSGSSEPTFMVGHGDGMSGLALAGGVAAALWHRERTGQAKLVDGSLLGTAVWFNAPSIISSMTNGTWATSKLDRNERPAGLNYYGTSDGRFLQFAVLGDRDDQWVDLCEHLGRPDLGTDPRFTSSELRFKNRVEAIAILDEIFAQRTLQDWKAVLATTKCVWQPLQLPEEIQHDPQVVANGFLRPIDTAIGKFKIPVPPVLFDEEGGDPLRAPEFGEHTAEVLLEVGFTSEQITEYRANGIIA